MVRVRGSLRRVSIAATVGLVIAAAGVVGHADWGSNSPWGTGNNGGDVSIWVSWELNPAVACSEIRLDEDGDVYTAMWVEQGPDGAGEDRQDARSGASDCWEEDKSPSGEWCGTVTALANFYYINPQGWWYEIDTWRPAAVYTEGCIPIG